MQEKTGGRTDIFICHIEFPSGFCREKLLSHGTQKDCFENQNQSNVIPAKVENHALACAGIHVFSINYVNRFPTKKFGKDIFLFWVT